MHKYTKWALVLLYLLQLVVVFREQLVHLYRSAVHSVNADVLSAAHGRGGYLGTAADQVKKAVTIDNPASRETLGAVSAALFTVSFISRDGDDGEEQHHDGDEDKDRARRHRRRRTREFIIMNLWSSLRVSVARAERSEPCNEISRVLTFA